MIRLPPALTVHESLTPDQLIVDDLIGIDNVRTIAETQQSERQIADADHWSTDNFVFVVQHIAVSKLVVKILFIGRQIRAFG